MPANDAYTEMHFLEHDLDDVAWWRNGQDGGLTINRSWLRLPVWSLSGGYYLDEWLSPDR